MNEMRFLDLKPRKEAISMNQQEIKNYLKKNSGVFLSAEEISKQTNTHLRSTYSKLKEIVKDPNIITKIVDLGVKRKKTILYSYVIKDKLFVEALREYEHIKRQREIGFNYHADTIVGLLTIKELKEIKGVLKDGKNRK